MCRIVKRVVSSAFIALFLTFLLGCAHTEGNRTWEKGDTVVCPYCGKAFKLPEKNPE